MRDTFLVAEPISGPVALWVNAVYARPKAMQSRKFSERRIWRSARPDLDNIIKAVADAAQKAEIINDDAQIVEIFARSLYAAIDEGPCVEVGLSALCDPGPGWVVMENSK